MGVVCCLLGGCVAPSCMVHCMVLSASRTHCIACAGVARVWHGCDAGVGKGAACPRVAVWAQAGHASQATPDDAAVLQARPAPSLLPPPLTTRVFLSPPPTHHAWFLCSLCPRCSARGVPEVHLGHWHDVCTVCLVSLSHPWRNLAGSEKKRSSCRCTHHITCNGGTSHTCMGVVGKARATYRAHETHSLLARDALKQKLGQGAGVRREGECARVWGGQPRHQLCSRTHRGHVRKQHNNHNTHSGLDQRWKRARRADKKKRSVKQRRGGGGRRGGGNC